MSLAHVPIALVPSERLTGVLTADQASEFRRTVARGRELLGGRVIWNVNSTARGGGVAEMLASLLAYIRGAGLDARWVVIDGDPDFFRITKRVHNMLHGAPGDGAGLGPDDDAIYRATAGRNAAELVPLLRSGDVVLLHDPQTAGLIEPVRAAGAHVVWRCHVGVDEAGEAARAAWRFLLPYVQRADAVVFSRSAYVWEGIDPELASVIAPSIDALSPKNQELDATTVHAILRTASLEPGEPPPVPPAFTRRDGSPGRVDRRAELNGSAPLAQSEKAVVQVSRWDRLKDPLGILDAFCAEIAPRGDAHLVLAGPSTAAVADDPEGAEALAEVAARREACPVELRERVHLFSLPMEDVAENAAIVNALQRRADVVVQKSLAEGFGLTVAEAMWKGRPVVASRVGGIREQLEDGKTGVLVDALDRAGFADAVAGLLDDPVRAASIGAAARAKVREQFLGPRHLREYLDLFERLLAAGDG